MKKYAVLLLTSSVVNTYAMDDCQKDLDTTGNDWYEISYSEANHIQTPSNMELLKVENDGRVLNELRKNWFELVEEENRGLFSESEIDEIRNGLETDSIFVQLATVIKFIRKCLEKQQASGFNRSKYNEIFNKIQKRMTKMEISLPEKESIIKEYIKERDDFFERNTRIFSSQVENIIQCIETLPYIKILKKEVLMHGVTMGQYINDIAFDYIRIVEGAFPVTIEIPEISAKDCDELHHYVGAYAFLSSRNLINQSIPMRGNLDRINSLKDIEYIKSFESRIFQMTSHNMDFQVREIHLEGLLDIDKSLTDFISKQKSLDALSLNFVRQTEGLIDDLLSHLSTESLKFLSINNNSLSLKSVSDMISRNSLEKLELTKILISDSHCWEEFLVNARSKIKSLQLSNIYIPLLNLSEFRELEYLNLSGSKLLSDQNWHQLLAELPENLNQIVLDSCDVYIEEIEYLLKEKPDLNISCKNDHFSFESKDGTTSAIYSPDLLTEISNKDEHNGSQDDTELDDVFNHSGDTALDMTEELLDTMSVDLDDIDDLEEANGRFYSLSEINKNEHDSSQIMLEGDENVHKESLENSDGNGSILDEALSDCTNKDSSDKNILSGNADPIENGEQVDEETDIVSEHNSEEHEEQLHEEQIVDQEGVDSTEEVDSEEQIVDQEGVDSTDEADSEEYEDLADDEVMAISQYDESETYHEDKGDVLEETNTDPGFDNHSDKELLTENPNHFMEALIEIKAALDGDKAKMNDFSDTHYWSRIAISTCNELNELFDLQNRIREEVDASFQFGISFINLKEKINQENLGVLDTIRKITSHLQELNLVFQRDEMVDSNRIIDLLQTQNNLTSITLEGLMVQDWNEILDVIPSEIASINLWFCNINGAEEIFTKFTDLNRLSLVCCRELSSTSLANIINFLPSSVIYLDLSYNDFSDDMATGILKMNELQYLSLEGCKGLKRDAAENLFKNLPSSVKSIRMFGISTAKRRLDLSYQINFSSSFIHSVLMRMVDHVESILVRNTQFDDEGLALLSQCKNIKELDISSCNNVTSTGLTEFLKNSPLALKHLLLSNTKLENTHLEYIQDIHSLEVLDLRTGGIEREDLLIFLMNLPSELKTLYIMGDKITQDDWMHNLDQIKSIEKLYLGKTANISKETFEWISSITQGQVYYTD